MSVTNSYYIRIGWFGLG